MTATETQTRVTKQKLLVLAAAVKQAKAKFSELNDPVKRLGLTLEQMVERDIEAHKALNASYAAEEAYKAALDEYVKQEA